jgi:hypothetical protein
LIRSRIVLILRNLADPVRRTPVREAEEKPDG